MDSALLGSRLMRNSGYFPALTGSVLRLLRTAGQAVYWTRVMGETAVLEAMSTCRFPFYKEAFVCQAMCLLRLPEGLTCIIHLKMPPGLRMKRRYKTRRPQPAVHADGGSYLQTSWAQRKVETVSLQGSGQRWCKAHDTPVVCGGPSTARHLPCTISSPTAW